MFSKARMFICKATLLHILNVCFFLLLLLFIIINLCFCKQPTEHWLSLKSAKSFKNQGFQRVSLYKGLMSSPCFSGVLANQQSSFTASYCVTFGKGLLVVRKG